MFGNLFRIHKKAPPPPPPPGIEGARYYPWIRDEKPNFFDGYAVALTPKPFRGEFDYDEPILRRLQEPKNRKLFDLHGPPVIIGNVWNRAEFSKRLTEEPFNLGFQSKPHGKKNNREYLLPVELLQFRDTFQACINCQNRYDPNFDKKEASLAVTQSPIVAGEMHRGLGGPHVDFGHFFSTYDCLPQVFYPDHGFNEVRSLKTSEARLEKAKDWTQWRALSYQITWFDDKMLHRGDIPQKEDFPPESIVWRTFFRVGFLG